MFAWEVDWANLYANSETSWTAIASIVHGAPFRP